MKFWKPIVLSVAGLSLGLAAANPSQSQASARSIPTSLRGTWTGVYKTTNHGYPFTIKIAKYTLAQNNYKYHLKTTKNAKTSNTFTLSSKPNKKGYWRFILTSSNDKMYLKRTTKNGRAALIRYSYDENHKPVVQYLYHH